MAGFENQNASKKSWIGSKCRLALQVGVVTNKGKFVMLPNGSLGFDESQLVEVPKTFWERIQNKILGFLLEMPEVKALQPGESFFIGTLEKVHLSFRIKNMIREEVDPDDIEL